MSKKTSRFVLCIKNDTHEASLEPRKIYLVVEDFGDRAKGLIRAIDESSEYYLYPLDFFAPIEVPEEAVPAFVTQ